MAVLAKINQIQFDGTVDSYLKIVKWMKASGDTSALANEVRYSSPIMLFQTSHGTAAVNPGEWLVQNDDGFSVSNAWTNHSNEGSASQFRSRETVAALRFDPANPPNGIKRDEGDGWFVEDNPYFVPASPGDWVLLDNQGRASDSLTDAEFREKYEPLGHYEAVQGLLKACESYDAAWTSSCPEGPDLGSGRLSPSTLRIWKQIRKAVAEYRNNEDRPT